MGDAVRQVDVQHVHGNAAALRYATTQFQWPATCLKFGVLAKATTPTSSEINSTLEHLRECEVL
jgi:hypothetical protein